MAPTLGLIWLFATRPQVGPDLRRRSLGRLLRRASLSANCAAAGPAAEFFGCAGPHLRAAGVEPVIRSEDLAVVGIVEVVAHLPRIWRRFRQLIRAARERKPARLAILTDSPDFHLRVARKLKRLGIPVVYLVAPQVWAWRKGRVKIMRRVIDRLLCIFPFEETFFRERGVPVTYIGHPLATASGRPFRARSFSGNTTCPRIVHW